nr:plasmid mobilization relaxosome protein MobC [Carbonactinospora thermoautotrophica]
MRLSDEEKEKIAARAEALGVSIQRLLVESALAGSAQTVTERRALVAELLGVRRLVAALGNNINQLARVANATGAAPPELAAAAAAVARAMARLDATVAGVSGRRS